MGGASVAGPVYARGCGELRGAWRQLTQTDEPPRPGDALPWPGAACLRSPGGSRGEGGLGDAADGGNGTRSLGWVASHRLERRLHSGFLTFSVDKMDNSGEPSGLFPSCFQPPRKVHNQAVSEATANQRREGSPALEA